MEARRPTLSRQHASRDHRYPASITTIWCLGLTLGLGSQCTGWTTTSAGVTSRAIAFGLLACAYLCLSFITAERTSALPFSGGVYAVGRCSLGYYLGFLIGSAEALSFVCYASALTLTVGHLVCDLAPDTNRDGIHMGATGVDAKSPCARAILSTAYVPPLVWIAAHGAILSVHYRGGRVFWLLNYVLAASSVTILLVYMGSAASHASFATLPDDGVRGDISAFMKDLPAHARFFVGLEGLSTVADSVHRPVDVLAHGHVRAMLTQCALGTGVFVITLGVPMSTDEVPTSVLSRGFALGWSISEASASIFALPPTVATLYGYVLATSSILASMTKSKLLPAELGELHVRHLSHSKALGLTSLSSLALCSLAYGVPMLERTLYAIAMVYAACVYIASSYASLHMKRRFGQLQYTWSNPLGRAGAVFGALVWAILLLALLGFQDDSLFIAVVVVVSSALLSACYHLYAKHRQSLSPEEQQTLFFAHVAFRNKRRHQQRAKVMRFGMSGMSQMASLRSTGRHGMVGAAKGVPPLVEREKRSSVIMKAETSLNLNTEGDKRAMRRNVSSRSTDNLHATVKKIDDVRRTMEGRWQPTVRRELRRPKGSEVHPFAPEQHSKTDHGLRCHRVIESVKPLRGINEDD